MSLFAKHAGITEDKFLNPVQQGLIGDQVILTHLLSTGLVFLQ